MRLSAAPAYDAHGLDQQVRGRLAALVDLIVNAQFNVSGVTAPEDVERVHILDSLSLLTLPCIRSARSIVDVGSGAGLPALVLAATLPAAVVAVESQKKKCGFIQAAAEELGLQNVTVCCVRAEDYGRGDGREKHDAAVSRALAALPAVAEYCLPMLAVGGAMVAMKGAISNQELTSADAALGILGGGPLEAVKMEPFPEAENRWVYIATKKRPTPPEFPRRVGVPTKRPLGS